MAVRDFRFSSTVPEQDELLLPSEFKSRVKAPIYQQAPVIGTSRTMPLQCCYTFDSDLYEPKYFKNRFLCTTE